MIISILYLNLFQISAAKAQSVIKDIQLDLKESILSKKKVLKIENTVYYNLVNGDMITKNTKPIAGYTITNTKGEMKVYDAAQNTIMISQSPMQSSELSVFNIFFSNQKADMNLKKMGFQIEKTEVDSNKNIVTIWKNLDRNKKVKKAKLVHEKFLPIYLAFYNEKNEVISKTYYSDFIKIDNYQLPLKITDISIIEQKKDSVIDRKVYSNVKFNKEVNAGLKNYQIPNDAKVVKLSK